MSATTAHADPHADPNVSTDAPVADEAHQHHPVRLYLAVWGWLFVLSACSYTTSTPYDSLKNAAAM